MGNIKYIDEINLEFAKRDKNIMEIIGLLYEIIDLQGQQTDFLANKLKKLEADFYETK